MADHCLFADFTEDPMPHRHKVSIQYSEMYLEEIAKQGKTEKRPADLNSVYRPGVLKNCVKDRFGRLYIPCIRRDR